MRTEMTKLIEMLSNSSIPFEVTDHWENSKQVWYPNSDHPVCDAVCFADERGIGSYGGAKGLLEIMGLSNNPEDDVEGYLTAEEVFNRMSEHYYADEFIPDGFDDECGFNPYMGCYDFDC